MNDRKTIIGLAGLSVALFLLLFICLHVLFNIRNSVRDLSKELEALKTEGLKINASSQDELVKRVTDVDVEIAKQLIGILQQK